VQLPEETAAEAQPLPGHGTRPRQGRQHHPPSPSLCPATPAAPATLYMVLSQNCCGTVALTQVSLRSAFTCIILSKIIQFQGPHSSKKKKLKKPFSGKTSLSII